MNNNDFIDLRKPRDMNAISAPEVQYGQPIHPVRRVEIFGADEWELFVHEWAGKLPEYREIKKHGGAGDKGCDVVGFVDENKWNGVWDNYQCKHYDHPLAPSDVWAEIGKIIYFSFKGEYVAPRKYYFIASKDVGTKLSKLFDNPNKLKIECLNNWENNCKKNITTTIEVPLEGELYDYFDTFDFSVFGTIPVLELIEGHKRCGSHFAIFGGGLPERTVPVDTPKDIQDSESIYIGQLLKAYSDHLKVDVQTPEGLNENLTKHFNRSRVEFYHAESLKNFSRDNQMPGVFNSLQNEIYAGVIDTCESSHDDALARVRATISKSGDIDISSNALHSRVVMNDRHGICHQLVNDNKMHWKKKDEQ